MFALASARRAWAIALLTLVAPVPAHAQFGGFIKRAIGEKVAEKVTHKAEGQKTDSAAGTIAAAAPVAANADSTGVHEEKASPVRICLDDAYFTAAQLRAKALQAKAGSDPLLLRRYTEAWPKYSAAAQEASARADTAAIRRVMMAYYREVFGASLISRQDTVAAQRKCGA
jgi:hypothetical protein